ncbi:hypothetical protein ANANG_G00057710 [Anguilla anguilla]|uniref:Profilin n=1 Tax=Anguilla anguilla TaxID=7936 RepID=A0A9D3MQ86_ANGAN|nr:hypothetical protein ANANG_G00057710 [Anguilla anguilla]
MIGSVRSTWHPPLLPSGPSSSLSTLRKCPVGRARAAAEYKYCPTSLISLCNFAKVTRTVLWWPYQKSPIDHANNVLGSVYYEFDRWWRCGTFGSITPEEIRKLVANDRSALFSSGVTVAGMRCTTLRDALNTEGQYTLDLKTKSSDQVPDTYGITVAKSKQALVIVKGKKDTHGGKLNTKAYKMAEHLRNSNY